MGINTSKQTNETLSDYDKALERINNCVEKKGMMLSLSGLNLSEKFPPIPEHISDLKIVNCRLKSLDSSIINHPNLKFLNCTQNQLTVINEFPLKLQKLVCNFNSLTELSNFNLKLRELSCNHNQLTSLDTSNTYITKLECSHNKLISLKFSEFVVSLDCSYNELTELPDLSEETYKLNCSYNKLTKFPKFPLHIDEFKAYSNSIEKIPKAYESWLGYMGKNPVFENLVKTMSFENSKLQTHSFEGEEFKTLTLPKGTVLFRSLRDSDNFIEGFIGYKVGNQYILGPDFEHYFFTHPFNRYYGQTTVIYVLNNDVQVILGLKPSKDYSKSEIGHKFGQECSQKKYKSKIGSSYNECLNDNFVAKYPEVLGWLAPDDESDTPNYYDHTNLKEYAKYIVYYENDKGITTRPELVIYPFKNRVLKDVVTEYENANYDYIKANIDKYNYRPIAIIDFNADLKEYKDVIDKLLSPSGYNNGDSVLHMTVNQNNGLYIISEFASPETLEQCLPISRKRKV